jgi:hypothetical protein
VRCGSRVHRLPRPGKRPSRRTRRSRLEGLWRLVERL